MCGACDVGAWGDVSGACEGVVERKYCSPLYYPDTLVNPDTCLGVEYSNLHNRSISEVDELIARSLA